MVLIRISKAAYEERGAIYHTAQDIINYNGNGFKYLDADGNISTNWRNAVQIQVKTDSLRHFTGDQFSLIATDPYGDVIDGTYLLKMDASLIDTEIPEYMSDRTYMEDEIEKIYTWREYLTSMYATFVIDGEIYYVAGHKQQSFTFHEILFLIYFGVAEIVLKEEWDVLKPQIEV